MFSPDFYPSPQKAIEALCEGLQLSRKKVLEPSAGSGKIVDYLQLHGSDVICCEINNDLAKIVSQKCHYLKPDFLQVSAEEISHVDYIIMNPPFSSDEKHILHAWEIAPEGCEIRALCNFETLNNLCNVNRKKLAKIVENNGNSGKLGSIFADAERKTKVIIGIVKLIKPKTTVNDEFDGYFDMTEDFEPHGGGIMTYSKAQDIVSRYVGAVRLWDEIQPISEKINSLIKPINSHLGIGFGAHYTDSNRHYSKLDRDIFKKELQKSAWRSIFDEMNMNKYVTSGVMSDINKFVEQQQNVPFTVKNIYKMLQMIVGTHAGRMDKVLVEAFDHICSLSADNSEAGEKWKTNSNYKVNRRFIDSYVCEFDSRWPVDNVKIRCGHSNNRLDDITKALCYLTGKKYDDVNSFEFVDTYGRKQTSQNSLYSFFSYNKIEWGQWVVWNEFFRVRGYKKGTMHFEFLDENVWMQFNRAVSKIKGWQIPQKTDYKQKGTERNKK